MNAIRIQYNESFRNFNKELAIPLSQTEFLAKKSLNNSKLKFKYCKKCEKTINQIKFQRHKQTCKIICTLCRKIFLTKKAFTTHIKKHDLDKGKVYYCPYQGCPRTYKKRENYKKHLQQCKLFTCQICINNKTKKIFTSRIKKVYDNHIIRHGIPTLTCDECGKLFHLNQDLKKHKKRHIGNKKFICIYCNRKYYTQNTLQSHEIICKSKKHNKFFQ